MDPEPTADIEQWGPLVGSTFPIIKLWIMHNIILLGTYYLAQGSKLF